jgi:hypothetical protein
MLVMSGLLASSAAATAAHFSRAAEGRVYRRAGRKWQLAGT